MQWMVEQRREAFDYCPTEPDTPRPVAFRVADLMKLLTVETPHRLPPPVRGVKFFPIGVRFVLIAA